MIDKLSEYYSQSFYELHPDKKFRSEWCINYELKLIFITINKCAGSSLREYLYYKNFDIIDNNKINDDFIIDKIDNNFNFYSVIRNPKDRYISGLNQFMFNTETECEWDKKKFIEENIKNNKFIFDEHLLPQNESICKVFKFNKKINFIRFDNNLSKKISYILKDKSIMPIINSSKEKKNCNLNFCIKLYNQYCEKNIKFYDLYKKDFELYKISLLNCNYV